VTVFGVLGPIRVCDPAGAVVRIGARKIRTVLAVLLAGAGERVSTGRLVDVLWEGDPPRSATANVHTYVWELRRWLPGRYDRPRIERDGEGYRLLVDPGELDAWSFDELTAAGRRELADGRIARGARTLAAALDLWRGAPYEDVAAAAPLDVARLLELRRLAQEDLLDARLRLGEHRAVLDDLRVLTTAEPLRELLWAQLMLALYRCGRRAEALCAYQQVHQVLHAELGVGPGTEIRELHHRILADDASLGGSLPRTGHRPRDRRSA
jgi:DNA-binding SARP family transcriptional activator